MIVRGLIVAASGFLFIFSPGVPIGLLSRRVPQLDRGLIYWGLGAWLLALAPGLFLQSLLRQAIYGGDAAAAQLEARPLDYVATLAGALISALLLQGVMYFILRRRGSRGAIRPVDGLALGIGVGLIAQVFTGLSLVGAGFRLTFGDTDAPALAAMAESGVLELALSLVPLILFRLALLAVSAAAGVLAARAVTQGLRHLWLAVGVYALFVWAILALQIGLGVESPGQFSAGQIEPLASAVTIVYYSAAFALAYAWVSSALAKTVPEP